MCVCRTMALISDTKQAMSEGKSGPVETGLTRPAATALHSVLLVLGYLPMFEPSIGSLDQHYILSETLNCGAGQKSLCIICAHVV